MKQIDSCWTKRFVRVAVAVCVCAGMGRLTAADNSPDAILEELEYIESSGTQYIDTGVQLNSETDEVEIDFMITELNATSGIFGSRNGAYACNYSLHCTAEGAFNMVCDNQGSGSSQHRFSLKGNSNTRYIVRNSRSSRSLVEAETSNVVGSDAQTAESFASTRNAYLFWGNVETTWQKAKMRLYGCTITRGGEPIRDFVPCRAQIDGVETVCLYDKVTKGFFTNMGEGAFSGPVKPKPLPDVVEEELEYIESSGTQYIDTGVQLNSETDEVEIDFKITGVNATSGIFGSRDGAYACNYSLHCTADGSFNMVCDNQGSGSSQHRFSLNGNSNTRYIASNSRSYRSLVEAGTSKVVGSDTQTAESFSSTRNAYLFWGNVETAWQKAKMRLYGCKITRGGVPLRDFVPCRALVGGVETVCLYDKVTKGFFTNMGEGAFTASPKAHGKIRIVHICDPQFGFVTANIPDRTAANHEKYYAEDLAAFRRMIPYVNAENADLVVIAGDLVQYSDELTRDWPDLLTQFKAPVLIVPGNHDLGQWNQAHTQYDSSTAYEQSYRDFVSFAGAGYGSRIIGNWRVVGMNSQFWQALDGSDYMNAQKGVHQDWYDGEVAAAKKSDQGLIVVSHVAPFVDSSNESDSHFNFPKSVRTTLMDQVIEAGGTSWLSGHSHLHRINTYGSLSIYIGEAMCANYANGGWPRGYTVLEVAAGSCEATWRDVTESEWRAAADDLLLHYRADAGVTTNEAGMVMAWKNLGKLGSAGDVTEVVGMDNEACASDIVLRTGGANGRASVVFGGSSCLKTSGDIDFDTDSSRGACWFVALKSGIDYSQEVNGCVMGLVDKTDETKRFGAFHPSASVNKKLIRGFAFQAVGCDMDNCPDGWFVLSHSAWGTSTSSGYNGLYANFNRGIDGLAVGPFFVGKLGTETWPMFKGEIAEIRCYSRALTPSERTAVQVEMGIYAESESIDFGSLDLFAAGNKVYTNDLAGFGTAPGIGKGEKCSAESGGLMACYADIPMSGANTLACLAHNGANGTGRVWCLAANKATAAEGHAHPLKLTSLTLNEGETYVFYYRSSTTERWTKLGDFIRDSPHSSPSIVLSAGWQDGYYRVKRPTGLCIKVY